MIKFKVQQTTEKINNNGGLSLIGCLLKNAGISKLLNKAKKIKSSEISEYDIVTSYLGLICMGKTDFIEIEQYREDEFFKRMLDIKKVPSEASLRQRLDNLGKVGQKILRKLFTLNISLLNRVELGSIKTKYMEYIPLDCDVTPMDNSGTNKEGCSYTYKNFDGFAPMMAYVGTNGYMLMNEFRIGKQHCQKGTPHFLRQCVKACNRLGIKDKILLRMDSGNDAAENFEIINGNFWYIIKRNPRKEVLEQWLNHAKKSGKAEVIRDGKIRYVGRVSHLRPGGREDLPTTDVVVEVIEKTKDRNGNKLLIPELKVNTFWTNLPEDTETIIYLYHQHGTSEQYHSEYKTEMGMERLPSGKFKTNKIIMAIGCLVFNMLRKLGIDVLKNPDIMPAKYKVKRRRIRSILQDIIYSACKYVKSKRMHFIKFGKHCPWFHVIAQLYGEYAHI